MHFLISLKDQNGQFWLQSERLWSEDRSYAMSFTDLDKAEAVASIARYRAKECADWFPKIQVVSFMIRNELTGTTYQKAKTY